MFVGNVRLSAKRTRAPAEPRTAVFLEPRPTAAVDTPLGQSQCRDSMDLVGDLRPEVPLRSIDDYQQRMFVGSIRRVSRETH